MNPDYLQVGQDEGVRDIAVNWRDGDSPGLLWLGGYRSDMSGTKALALDKWAQMNGFACCRFDYSGHGQSGGKFIDGTITRWLEESLAVFDKFTNGPQILIGSSMGAWVALRLVSEILLRGDSERLKALLLLAPAPDFTHELMMPHLSDEHKQQLETKGFMQEQSKYSDEPDIFTRALFEDGEKNLVMNGMIETLCPVHIIQGMRDEDVPFSHAMKLINFLPGENVTMTLVKDGDHRLSREHDIGMILQAVKRLGRDETSS